MAEGSESVVGGKQMNKRCPYCNQEMESGYIQCRDGVTWTKKLQPVAALSWLSSTAVHLSESAFNPNVEAYICKECRKIIIDY